MMLLDNQFYKGYGGREHVALAIKHKVGESPDGFVWGSYTGLEFKMLRKS